MAGFVARMEERRLSECVMFCGLHGGAIKRMNGVSSGRPQSFRYLRRPVHDCNPEQGEIEQDDRTRGGTFHGGVDSCRESQGWATAWSSMPERDRKANGEDSPRQACSSWFSRHS